MSTQVRHTPAVLLAAVPLTLLLAGFLTPAAVGSPLFEAPFLVFETGKIPQSVAIGDLNGDGKPDLATANGYSDSVSVLLTNGEGTFGPKSDYGTGKDPLYVAIGDLNGDGKPDLAVANFLQGTVSVLLGNGDGTFGPKSDYQTQSAGSVIGPYSVAIGDLNGDGKPDLATATGYSSVSVLLGNGDGTFGPKSDFATSGGTYAVAIADLNGDGKPDLATTTRLYPNSAASVQLGHGDGTFGPSTDYATGTNSSTLAIGDLNGDGRPDLVVGNLQSNTVSVLLGNGDGTFAPRNDYGTGWQPNSVAIGDLNGDGKPDLATANNSSNGVSVLLGNGDGTFQLTIDYGAGAEGSTSVAIGDLNVDGNPDLAATGYNGTVSVLLGNGDGTLGKKLANEYGTGRDAASVAIGDLNGDGKRDLVTANVGLGLAGTVGVLLGKGDGSFGTNEDYGTGIFPAAVAIADLNGDGKLDLATANHVSSVSVLLANGDGTFGTGHDYATGDDAASLVIGDLNGDGKPDVATANEGANTVSVLLGNGDGTFKPKSDFAARGNPISVAMGDLNGDGKPDLATANPADDTVSVLLGNGDGTFGPHSDYAAAGYPNAVAIGDLNGDGRADLATANQLFYASTVAVFLGNGDGTLGSRNAYGSVGGCSSLAIGDLNGDRKPDLAVMCFSMVSALLGNGDGTFGQISGYGTRKAGISLAIGDLNGDGKRDVATGNLYTEGGSLVSVLLNVGPAPNADPDCSHAYALPAMLRRRDHRLVPIDLNGVSDPNGDPVSIRVTRVSQDEPLRGDDSEGDDESRSGAHNSGHGDEGEHHGNGENKCPDAVIGQGRGVAVRAESASTGNGRVYMIGFTASDGHGGSCDGSVRVCVPRDRRQLVCVDDGQSFNSLDNCAGRHDHDRHD